MRLIAILALALSLTGCNGDRIKDSMNVPQVQRAAGFSASTAASGTLATRKVSIVPSMASSKLPAVY